MDLERELWFGALNGMHVVYDPEIQIPRSRWVLLFQVRRNCQISCHKAQARSVLNPLGDPDSRVGVLKAYEAWRRTATQSMLDDAANDIRRKDEHLKERLANALAMHRRCLEMASIAYCSVTEPLMAEALYATRSVGGATTISALMHIFCAMGVDGFCA